jgi:hypothetical protein
VRLLPQASDAAKAEWERVVTKSAVLGLLDEIERLRAEVQKFHHGEDPCYCYRCEAEKAEDAFRTAFAQLKSAEAEVERLRARNRRTQPMPKDAVDKPEWMRHQADALEKAYGPGQAVVNTLRDAADTVDGLREALSHLHGLLVR